MIYVLWFLVSVFGFLFGFMVQGFGFWDVGVGIRAGAGPGECMPSFSWYSKSSGRLHTFADEEDLCKVIPCTLHYI